MLRTIALAAVVLAAPWLRADARPISPTERAAVEIAAAYLAGGPSAIAGRVAPASPLHAFDAAARAAELEVRLGPAAEAQWELQTIATSLKDRNAAFTVTYPSGFEDHLLFELVPERGGFALQDVRFLAQPRASAVPSKADAAQPKVEAQPVPRLAYFGAILGAIAVLVSLFVRRQRVLFAPLASSGAFLFLIAIAVVMMHGRTASAPAVRASMLGGEANDPARLAPLLPLRRALADGRSDALDVFASTDRRREDIRHIAELWRIQFELMQSNTRRAKEGLAAFASPSDTPLVEHLRAQIAILENDSAGAAIAFERAVDLGPARDALWLENANMLYALGFEDRAKASFLRAARIGSRDANVEYTLAMLAASAGDDAGAEQHLRTAWQMEPVAREQLLTTGVLASTLRRPGVLELISVSTAEEPLVASPNASVQAAAFPDGAEITTTGDALRVVIGTRELHVPGGAALAPRGTRIASATERDSIEQERHLADLASLVGTGGAAAYAQPALRERLTATTQALAQRNRWNDILALTDNVEPAAEHVPPDIFYLRAIALQRMQRKDEASLLLAQFAKSPVLQRRRDATAMARLAELFAAQDLFEAAVKMYDRSQRIRPNPMIDDRVRQILMNQRLATRYGSTRTAHFEIRYPSDATAASVVQLGTVLENEFLRLQQWIPVPSFKPVVVNMVWWQEFRSTYTGNDFILGFYNGKITVPVAGIDSTNPQITAILGHELAHAMIAQATGDQAPRWFQEGFAQLIEERAFHENAFNMYDDAKMLPVALLDPALESSDAGLVTAGYIVAQTDVRYIETKYGKDGLHAMLRAFRDGATTEEALRRVCRKSLVEFENELRVWGRRQAAS